MNALSKQSTGCDFYSRLVIQSRVDFIVLKLTELVEVGLLTCWCTYLGIVPARPLPGGSWLYCSFGSLRATHVLMVATELFRSNVLRSWSQESLPVARIALQPVRLIFVADIVSVVDKDATVDGGYWSCFTLQTDRGFCDLYSHKWKVKISVTVRYKSLYFPLCSIQSCPARKTHNHKLHWIVLRKSLEAAGQTKALGPKKSRPTKAECTSCASRFRSWFGDRRRRAGSPSQRGTTSCNRVSWK